MEEHKHEHEHEHHHNHDNQEELIMKASIFQRQAEQLSNNLAQIEAQVLELSSLAHDLNALKESSSNEMISSIAKGVYIKTNLVEKNLLVNVGSDILVKKTPEETQIIIEEQVKKLNEARLHLKAQLEIYNNLLRETIAEIEESARK